MRQRVTNTKLVEVGSWRNGHTWRVKLFLACGHTKEHVGSGILEPKLVVCDLCTALSKRKHKR